MAISFSFIIRCIVDITPIILPFLYSIRIASFLVFGFLGNSTSYFRFIAFLLHISPFTSLRASETEPDQGWLSAFNLALLDSR